jgi:uncharacterized protein (DUF362 family)
MKPVVSLKTYESSPESLKETIELCGGFDALKQTDRVLIKPNLVAWDDRFGIAPFGVYTTTRLVEDLIICLKDFGCNRITIGEGSVQIQKGVGTMRAFEGLGYVELAKRYGVDLVDFNESDAEKIVFHDDLKLHIAREALESDFVINFPVLKTHGQTKVSLGLKNLKGCLKLVSKKFCHNPDLNLEYCFSYISDFVKPSLTLVDGIYALEKGALHFGKAYRKNLIVGTTDGLAADLAGAALMGYAGADIDHFGHYADRHGKSLDLDDYDVQGEAISDHAQPLKWDWTWDADNTMPGAFKKMGVSGVALPKYDDSLCSGCSPIANMSNILVISAFKGEPLPKVEILNGKKMMARPGYDQTVLMGNCMIKANKDNPNVTAAVAVKGCPPSEDDVVDALTSVGFDVNVLAYHGYMKQQAEKYEGKSGFDSTLFTA